MSMNNSGLQGLNSGMNVTPLIDVLLVLLIIFMVIVPATSKGESALAPRASVSDQPADDAVVLEVLSRGGGEVSFRLNRQVVTREELATRLAGIYARRAQRVLFVKGDDQVSFTQIAEVIDIGHAAGVDHVGLITPKVAAGL